MTGRNIKSAFLATAAAGIMMVGMGVSPASAVPVFTIDPSALGSTGHTPQVESDVNGHSDATIRQTAPGTQVETGFLHLESFDNNGFGSSFIDTGLFTAPLANTYGLYIKFSATVTGITGFGPGQAGTIAPGGFTFALYADLSDNNAYAPGSPNAGGSDPTITNTGDDIVLAVGSSVSGSAGFQAGTGAPIFSAISSFILCDGTANEGKQGGVTVTASNTQGSCGSFNGATYFTAPVPFYNVDFASTTAGSAGNLHLPTDGTVGAATLNGIQADINFDSVPEPGTLSLLGAGLMLLGFGAWRRKAAV